ncbi:MAG: PQQ-dependent dehydrogenase, methanol/ethanol family [Ponticaulis sp.]|nr:PQQ-dependent dehydrogenase, methanol/ethanol family [Ponticaulis sp.]
MVWLSTNLYCAASTAMLALMLASCAPDAKDDAGLKQSALWSETDWPLHGRDSKEQRFSPLSEISTETVGTLGLAWEYSDFIVRGRTHRGMEASPIVVDGVMYLTGPWSVVYAVDAQSGEELWMYDPEVEGAWARKTCCDVVNRGVAIDGSHLLVGTIDGYLDAVDVETGERIWRTDTLIDRERAYSITGAPRLAGDLVLIGNGGAELGVRGYVSAYHIDSGDLAWRFYTVPGDDDDESAAIAAARESWGADTRWEFGGGGTVWDSMTYDADLGVIYVGVGNGSPWPKWARDPALGDNLYLSSILALRAETGELLWHYQTTPGDSWDYTATQNIILADLEINGEVRKVLMQAPKNGFFYVIDRVSGALLSAQPYTHVSWADGVDLETGRPRIREGALYGETPRVVWPGTPGGHNWPPMAFSPETGLVYIPVLEMPQKFSVAPKGEFLADTMNVSAIVNAPPFSSDDPAVLASDPRPVMRSVLKAFDPQTGEIVWQSDDMAWWGGGVLATAGGLVVQGSSDGHLRFFDATTGDVLKDVFTGTGIMAPPVSYAIGDDQYIAVAAGYGGAQLARLFPGMAALEYQNSERLLAYRLGGRDTALPELQEPEERFPVPDDTSDDPDRIAAGMAHFRNYCGRCHAPMGAPNGYPDLWNLSPASHASFASTVLDGDFAYAGMAGFSDALSEEDVEDLRAFIVSTQRRLRARQEAQTP